VYRLRLQGRRISQAINEQDAGSKCSVCCIILADLLFGLLLDSEDGSDVLLKRPWTFPELQDVIPRRSYFSEKMGAATSSTFSNAKTKILKEERQ
jgi:hypothetical protein